MAVVSIISLSALPDPKLSATQQRQENPDFIARCAIPSLAGRLPLRWPTPPQTPPSPKRHYRSHYQPPDPTCLPGQDEAAWSSIALFDLLLILVDFSGLLPVLASKLYRNSARGRQPFDPISLFLLFAWQTINRWKRSETLLQLAKDCNAHYAAAFGFRPGVYPSEGGVRYFLTTIGHNDLNDLLMQSMQMVQAAGLIPPEVSQHAVVSFDGQIHDAASSMHCRSVESSCYQPTSEQNPRPCPATDAGNPGCQCLAMECKLVCCKATPRDPEARYVYYAGRNQDELARAAGDAPPLPAGSNDPAVASPGTQVATPPRLQGEGHYGYRSLGARLADPLQRANWTLAGAALAGANTREEGKAGELLKEVVVGYSWLHVDAVVGDSGLGYEPFLGVAADLGIRRIVDLRCDPRTDYDKDGWAIRGYDNRGWPVCQFGYRMSPNGYDSERHRSKWYCAHACEGQHQDAGQAGYPPDCPYRDKIAHPHGKIVNVGKTFPDGSLRLVRDLPYGSASWKRIYRRARNAAEERNSKLEAWGLKRLSVFGTYRAQATIFLADVWVNLMTLARLIKEATLAQIRLSTHSS